MNPDIKKVVIRADPNFIEFTKTIMDLVQTYSQKRSTAAGTLIASTASQSVNPIPIERLLEAINSQHDKQEIELSPSLGEFYLQLIGLAYDIAIQMDWHKKKRLRRFVKTCQAQYPNLREGYNN